ncbi:MAG: hypothetical protein M1820_003190 [Bogoriella megaspora]|nr:MAG: hypothetical protein M1820_003190 [Bogoriella megaspora]
MPQQSVWNRTKTGSKAGFDKLWAWSDKLGAPVNKLSNRLGSEAFWPTTLDKESDKAARILRSFCKDGFYTDEDRKPADGPTARQRVVKKVPPEVIRKAKGLAIFTTMRTGLWVSGAGGSGILIGRKEDGTWSPPSGILLHTAGLGFLIGVDIYDCVVVINTQKALDAFSKLRCTLGGEVSAVAGPVGAGGMLETEIHKRQAPVFTYLKSRGFYAGVQVDGTVIIERTDENANFYGEKISCADILAGKVRHPPYELKMLMETLKAAEGDKNVNTALLPSEPPPGDYEVKEEADGPIFGIPDKEDDDPFGVRALQEAGLEIREATTRARASADEFEFRPSPTSPIYPAFNRRSMDGKSNASISRRSSWRTSTLSNEIRTPTVDSATQTEFGDENAPQASSSPPKGSPNRHSPKSSMGDIPEYKVFTTPPTTIEHLTSETKSTSTSNSPSPVSPSPIGLTSNITSASISADDLPADDEEPVVVHEVQHAASPQVLAKARLVTVPKRAPPALPPRNPGRASKGTLVINAEPRDGATSDTSVGVSPISLHGGRSSVSALSLRSELREVDDDDDEEGFKEVSLRGGEDEDEKMEKEGEKDSRVDSANEEGEVHEHHVEDKRGAKRAPSPRMPGGFDDDAREMKEVDLS